MNEKLCWWCKHFRFEPGYPGYSEYTPGEDANLYCGRGYWALRKDLVRRENAGLVVASTQDLQKALHMAGTCADFTREVP